MRCGDNHVHGAVRTGAALAPALAWHACVLCEPHHEAATTFVLCVAGGRALTARKWVTSRTTSFATRNCVAAQEPTHELAHKYATDPVIDSTIDSLLCNNDCSGDMYKISMPLNMLAKKHGSGATDLGAPDTCRRRVAC